MPTAQANGIEIYYETFGDDADPALLLVNGLGSQSISWDDEFCEGLVDRGFFVIRFDNRDVGLSTKIDQEINFVELFTKLAAGEAVEVPYTLSDMAADAVGLLDHLGIDAAHVVGVSMGGMITQTIAIEHPARVLSITSIMSTTGDPDVGHPTPQGLMRLTTRPPAEREPFLANAVESARDIGSPEYFDPERAREKAAAAYDRCFYPFGVGRQFVGVMATGSRSDALRKIDVPALVIHGTLDPLIDVSGGRRTAEVIPGAELLVIEGMGHDLPPQLWAQIIEPITRMAASVAAA